MFGMALSYCTYIYNFAYFHKVIHFISPIHLMESVDFHRARYLEAQPSKVSLSLKRRENSTLLLYFRPQIITSCFRKVGCIEERTRAWIWNWLCWNCCSHGWCKGSYFDRFGVHGTTHDRECAAES